MNRTIVCALLLSAILVTMPPSNAAGQTGIGTSTPTVELDGRGDTKIGANTTVAGNSVSNEAVVPGRMRADPTDPAQNVEGAVYFNTSTQKHRVFRGGAWHDLGSGSEDLLLAGSSPCDAAHAGKKALTVDIANAPVNTFPPAPPYVANIRWATCTSGTYRGRQYWVWQ